MTEQIKIRPATEADAEALSELICENAEAILHPHYTERQWNIFIKYYSVEVMESKIGSQEVFCGVIGDEIVGTIALEYDFVVGFYTRMSHLKRGVGTQMMRFIEGFARDKYIEELQLAASPASVDFYYKLGWQKVRNITMEHYGVSFEETLMVKVLTE